MPLTADGGTRSKLNALRTFCGLDCRSYKPTCSRQLETSARLTSEPGRRLTGVTSGLAAHPVAPGVTPRRRVREVDRAQRRELCALEAGTLAEQPVMQMFASHIGDPTTGGDPLRERAPDDHHGLRGWHGHPGCGGQHPCRPRGGACCIPVLAAGEPCGSGVVPRRDGRAVLVDAAHAAPRFAVKDEN